MKRIVLVRHASTEWTGSRYQGRADLPLSAAGEREAAALARTLAASLGRAAPVYASPALRAVATARAIATELGSEVRSDDRLLEVDCGRAEGATFAELERRWPELAARLMRGDVRFSWPDGESWSELLVRAVRFWCDLVTDRAPEGVVVTHGVLASALLHVGTDVPGIELAPSGFVVLNRDIDRWIPQRALEVA